MSTEQKPQQPDRKDWWLEIALNNLGSAVIVTDTDRIVVFANAIAERLIGRTEAEAVGTPISQVFRLVDPETGQSKDNLADMALRDRLRLETRVHLLPSGTQEDAIPIDANVAPILDETETLQGAVFAFSEVRDRVAAKQKLQQLNQNLDRQISQRNAELRHTVERLEAEIAERQRIEAELHRREAQLHQREQEFRALVENSPDIITRFDRQFRHLYVNPAIERATGRKWEEFIGKTNADLNMPIDLVAQWEDLLTTAFENASEIVSEFTFPTPTGTRYYQARIVPEFNADGNLETVLGTVRDITDLRSTELALRESEEKFRLSFEDAPIGMALCDVEGNIVQANPVFCRLLGYSEAELQQMNIKSLSPPEDLHREYSYINRVIAGEASNYQIDKRYICKDGSTIWTHLSAGAIRDRLGNIRYGLGMVENVTERREIEEQLKLRDRAIKASNNGIVITDARQPDLPIIYVNPAFEQMTGYSAAEVLGQNCRFLQGSDRDQPNLNPVRTALQQGTNCSVTLRNYRKDGSLFWNELNISPIEDDSGNVTHFIGIQTDISDRVETQRQLETSLRQKNILLKEIHHRVKNNLQNVMSLLRLQAQSLDDRNLTQLLRESQNRIRAMAIVHEYLYDEDRVGKIDSADYVRSLVRHLYESYRSGANNIEIQQAIDPVQFDLSTAIPFGLLVTELLSNALKYAFPETREGQIWVRLHYRDARIALDIRDNGVGLPVDFEIEDAETLGSQLILSLVNQLDGTLTLTNDGGANFEVVFPFEQK